MTKDIRKSLHTRSSFARLRLIIDDQEALLLSFSHCQRNEPVFFKSWLQFFFSFCVSLVYVTKTIIVKQIRFFC